MDRTIHFGDDAADARYRIQDTSSTGGDLVLAEDLDGGTVLLEYDYSASEWVSRGPVNLSGNDITNAGSVSADTLEANETQTDRTWFGDLSTDPDNPDTILFNSKGSGISNQPQANFVAVGKQGVSGDNNPVNLISLKFEDGGIDFGQLTVSLRRQGGSTESRTDEVKLAQATGISTETVTRGTPGSTAYSINNGYLQIAIDDAGNSYDIIATGHGGLIDSV